MIEKDVFEQYKNQMEDYAQKHDVPIIQEEGLHFLVDYVKENQVKTILEIGSAIGYSAIMMASVNSDIKVNTIEIDPERYQEAVKNIHNVGMENQIMITLGDALEWEPTGQYDLIFIDAAKAQYTKFFERYAPLLSENGAILTDNLAFHGYVENPSLITSRNLRQLVNKIQKYIDYLKSNEEFETVFYELGDGIAVSRKK